MGKHWQLVDLLSLKQKKAPNILAPFFLIGELAGELRLALAPAAPAFRPPHGHGQNLRFQMRALVLFRGLRSAWRGLAAHLAATLAGNVAGRSRRSTYQADQIAQLLVRQLRDFRMMGPVHQFELVRVSARLSSLREIAKSCLPMR